MRAVQAVRKKHSSPGQGLDLIFRASALLGLAFRVYVVGSRVWGKGFQQGLGLFRV